MAYSRMLHCVVVVDFRDMLARVMEERRLPTEAALSARQRNEQFAERGEPQRAFAVPQEIVAAGRRLRFRQ